ncbi:hypothetical protein VP01_3102g4, partial [Puccinia sorghi]
RDLAISFSNYQVLRSFQSSYEVQSVLKDNPLVQRSLGYNSKILQNGQIYPTIHGHPPKQDPKLEIPPVLKINYPNSNIKKIVSIKLSTKEVLREGMFSLESNSSKQGGNIVLVDSIWETSPWKYYVRVNHCQKTGTQIDNEMTIIEKQFKFSYTPAQNILCYLNAQKNCFAGRTVSHHIQHSNTNSYILNSYSHSMTRWHEVLFDEQVQQISSELMSDVVQQELKIWQKEKDTQPQEGFIPVEYHHPTVENLKYPNIAPSTTAMPASHIPTQNIIPSLHPLRLTSGQVLSAQEAYANNPNHPSQGQKYQGPHVNMDMKCSKYFTKVAQIENQPKSHSNEPQESNEPPHNPDLQVHLPEDVTKFVDKIYDVKGDRHCGYRAAALCLGRGQDAYMEIRRELYEEIEMNKAFYIKQGTFNNLPLTLKSILTQTSGPAMENAFRTPVFYFCPSYSQTCFLSQEKRTRNVGHVKQVVLDVDIAGSAGGGWGSEKNHQVGMEAEVNEAVMLLQDQMPPSSTDVNDGVQEVEFGPVSSRGSRDQGW